MAGQADPLCERCAAPPRDGAEAAGPPVLSYAGPRHRPRFPWVWCHFWRNACLILAALNLGVFASGKPVERERPAYLVAGCVQIVLAGAWHAWHARVCLRGGPRP